MSLPSRLEPQGLRVAPTGMAAVVPLLLLLALMWGPMPSSAQPPPGRAAMEGGFDRMLVVTFVQGPVDGPGSAGSTESAYAPRTYVSSARARRTATRVARELGLERVDAWPIRALGVHCVLYLVPPGSDPSALLERLRRDPRVESAQPLQRFETYSEPPGDPYFEMQHGLEALRVPSVHAYSRGAGVTVAVVDTGVDSSHPDLRGNVPLVRDFVTARTGRKAVPEVHGTAVAGVIASRAGNGLGTVGVAPRARIQALRACWEESGRGTCSTFTLAKALGFVADEKPDVLNLSLSGPTDPLLERLLREVQRAGIAVVAAHDERKASFPASSPGVIVVGSQTGAVAGAGVVHAPGTEILAPAPGERFDFVNGSSFAAAHVSGVLALMLERRPRLRLDEMREALQSTARASEAEPDARLVDACAALGAVDPEVRCEPPTRANAAQEPKISAPDSSELSDFLPSAP